jgi:SPP1 gp7 family putative phage head morphogenesis protein
MAKTVRIKKDPSRAKPLIREYEKRIGALFEGYEERAQRILRVADVMGRRDILFNDLREASRQLNGPGQRVVEDMTLKAYKHGQQYADLQLKRAGVDANKKLQASTRKHRALAGVGIDYSFTLAPDQAIFDILLGKSLANLKGITEEMSKKIVQELSEGILLGEGMDDLAKRLTTSIESIGFNRSLLLARTETMTAVNQATLSRYNKAGVTMVQWITAPDDGRTCKQCLDLDRREFPINDVPVIPVHPNCRCALAPVPGD